MSDVESAVLNLKETWRTRGRTKSETIATLGITTTRYYLVLNRVLTNPYAWTGRPELVGWLLRSWDRRVGKRSSDGDCQAISVADNEYPADGFDRLADARTIRGTHRRKELNLKWWLALVAIMVLAPIAGQAIPNYIGSSEEEPMLVTSVKEVPSGAPSGVSPMADPSGDPSPSGGNKPSGSSEPSKNPSTDTFVTPSEQESNMSADAGADRPVLVPNGSKKPGLAATGKQKLEKASYTEASADNYSGGSPAVSIVFCTKASDAQAAKQVATALSIRPGNIVPAPRATGDGQIVVTPRTDVR